MKKTKAVVYFRRKREGRTDYRLRLRLLKSRLPRIVVRKSNKHILLQLVEYAPDGDIVKCSVSSRRLASMGWSKATSNIPAAYLTGRLMAKAIKALDVNNKLIVDIGLQTHKPGSRLYAAVKGVIDGGVDVICSESIFPPEDRLNGVHNNMKEDVKALLAKI